MDKFEYKVRADEILELIGKGEYEEAAEIADSIDWRRVKSVTMLCTISDLYKANKRYEDAKNVLLMAYERRPGGRTICYALCELCIKTGEFGQAVNYYKEFTQVAPKDSGKYILQYRLLEAQDASLEERIEVLEELKTVDHREKWSYELAYLYHMVGQASRCVLECDDLILWFGEGKYVYKAMELKMQHQPLSPDQQAKYDRKLELEKEAAAKKEAEEKAAAERQAVAEGKTVIYPNGKAVVEPVGENVSGEGEQEGAEPDIQVKTMDVGQYNTINLQAELAAGLQEILRTDAITGAIMEPMLRQDETEAAAKAELPGEADDVSGKADATGTAVEETEVFFGETAELGQVQNMLGGDTGDFTEITLESLEEAEKDAGNESSENVAEESVVKESVAEEAVEASPESASEEMPAAEADREEQTETDAEKDETAQVVMEQMRLENAGLFAVQPPKELENVLSQDSDGQIRLVMPESEAVEKQITGQLNIHDIWAEWERMRQESEEKCKEEVRRHVQQQTGTMFTEFDASIRDGLLEKLEAGEQVDLDTLQVVETAPETDEDEVEEIAEIEEVVESTEDIADAKDAAEIEDVTEEATEETDIDEVEETAEEAEETETDGAEEESEETDTDEVEEIAEIEEVVESAEDVADEEVVESTEDVADAEDTAETEDVTEEGTAEPEYVPEPVVERPRVRALTREERELYAPFIQSRSAKERLVTAIDNISMAAYTGNLVVTGEEGMDTMSLAKNIVREIQMMDSNFSGKVAKVSGEGLNQRNVAMTVSQLNNGALIIQKASGMSEQTVEDLYKALQQESLGIVVVLEDTKRAVNNLFATYPKLENSFTARMDVEALSNDTLVAFGRSYAREMEFSIDDLGVLALHTRIEEMQTSDHVVTVLDVKKIMDEAMHHATRKTLKHFMDVIFARRYDDEDMIILTEKDFV